MRDYSKRHLTRILVCSTIVAAVSVAATGLTLIAPSVPAGAAVTGTSAPSDPVTACPAYIPAGGCENAITKGLPFIGPEADASQHVDTIANDDTTLNLTQSQLKTLQAQNQPMTFVQMSDTHVFDTSLYANTPYFRANLAGDNKLLIQSNAIFQQSLDKLVADYQDKGKPLGMLLISGDLTKDGEYINHKLVEQDLEAFHQRMPSTKIYVIDGNHDINNSNGLDFAVTQNVAGAQQPTEAQPTDPQEFKSIYKLTYDDPSIVATFTPPAGKQAGGLSYVARPAPGTTVIALDTARYSSDNTDSGTDEHETSGQISQALQNWAVAQIKAAKDRGDTVIMMGHHAITEHFASQANVMKEFVINNYEKVSTAFADAGLNMYLDGHTHANDIHVSTFTSGGVSHTLVDTQTGSLVTYPNEYREYAVTKNIDPASKTMKTTYTENSDGITSVTYQNPDTGKNVTANLQTLAKTMDLTPELVSDLAVDDVATSQINEIQSGGLKAFLEKTLGTSLDSEVGSLLAANANLTDWVNWLSLGGLVNVDTPLSIQSNGTNVTINFLGFQATTTVSTLVDKLITPLLQQVTQRYFSGQPAGTPIASDTVTPLKSLLSKGVGDIFGIPLVTEGGTTYTVGDLANQAYLGYLHGDEDFPQWAGDAQAVLSSATTQSQIKAVLAKDVANEILVSNYTLPQLSSIFTVTTPNDLGIGNLLGIPSIATSFAQSELNNLLKPSGGGSPSMLQSLLSGLLNQRAVTSEMFNVTGLVQGIVTDLSVDSDPASISDRHQTFVVSREIAVS